MNRRHGLRSFADLEKERETTEAANSLRNVTRDFVMMVDNIMWREQIEDKPAALRDLFAEFVVIVEDGLSDVDAAMEADLSESATAITLSEIIDQANLDEMDDILENAGSLAELSNPRRFPVLVDFSIIKPGPGNKKDNRFYPAEMLERDRPQFEGADIFVTNHNADEKNERTKVGRFRNIGSLTEQGLMGQAIIYDPDVAEKTRNRADAGELGTLHCSIHASGTGKKGTIDGQEYTVIESITKVHSVDLVSRAGAGGQAVALAESENGGTMTEPEETTEQTEVTEQGDQPVAEVEIHENDQETTETAAAVVPVTETAPEAVTSARVSEILSESGLDESAQSFIINGTYQTEGDVTAAIERMKAYSAGLANAGAPFAMGETEPVEDKPLTLTELEQRKQDRFLEIMAGVDPAYVLNL
jgi:hypothetical protein